MAKLSLQQQLLQAGLISSAAAKTIKTEKHKQQKQQQKQGITVVDEVKLSVQQTKAEQAEKDRLLNLQKQQMLDQKAKAAQVQQWLQLHQQNQDPEGSAYHFTDGTTVKTLYVNDKMRSQLSRGRIAIVKADQGYVLIDAAIAEKIAEFEPERLLLLNSTTTAVETEDPYADYVIPDNLMW
ncbi:MAG: hypothetical protein RL637_764 [Pseudomonadota bacterium]